MKITQFGKVIVIGLGLGFTAFVVAAIIMLLKGMAMGWVMAVGAFSLATALALFYKLEIRVDHMYVRAIFGIGLLQFKWDLSTIEEAAPVKNSWIMGWGIRILGSFTLYNVSGCEAVELNLKNRTRKVRIGTDQPQLVSEYINQQLQTAA